MSIPKIFVTSVVGSYIRPKWLLRAFEAYDKGKLSREELEECLSDAVLVAVKEQELAGIDVISDGEQRRRSFVAFLAQKVKGFKLLHVSQLHPFAWDLMRSIGAQITLWRPVAVEQLEDSVIAADEVAFAKMITAKPLKVAVPSPYLVMWEAWHSELSKQAYPDPESLAEDYVKILRNEIQRLVQAGAFFIQLDDPMLGDLIEASDREPDRYRRLLGIIYGQRYRGFRDELSLAVDLINEAIKGYTSTVRIGIHMCRWPRRDSEPVGYEKLLPDILDIKAKQLVLEYASPRCGDPLKFLEHLPSDKEVGYGCVSVRRSAVENPYSIVKDIEKITRYVDPKRIWLNPSCGFAPGMHRRPFPRSIAFAKLKALAEAAKILRERYGE